MCTCPDLIGSDEHIYVGWRSVVCRLSVDGTHSDTRKWQTTWRCKRRAPWQREEFFVPLAGEDAFHSIPLSNIQLVHLDQLGSRLFGLIVPWACVCLHACPRPPTHCSSTVNKRLCAQPLSQPNKLHCSSTLMAGKVRGLLKQIVFPDIFCCRYCAVIDY